MNFAIRVQISECIMCHLGSLYNFRVQIRRSDDPQRSTVILQEERSNGGGELMKLLCVCSPTQHKGSFRCRLHRAEYVWGCKSGNLSSGDQME